MGSQDTTVVIGAGPYGLSVAAHLKAQGAPTLVFGKTMEFWQKMPSKMYLKSVWTASTFDDPYGAYSLNQYVQATKTTRQEPVPLPFFLDYGHWFQQHAISNVDPTYVSQLSRDGKGFHLDLSDGRSVKAGRVIVAVGIELFTHVPHFAQGIPNTLASHTHYHNDFSEFKGRMTIVIGSGQSGLETAALLHEAGADVELIARGPIIWIDRRLYHYTGVTRHIFYPPSDVGPPGLNQLAAHPLLYRRLSDQMRQSLAKRAIRPAGADWLRARVEHQVRVTPFTQIQKMTPQGRGVCLELGDGTTREADYVFLGTGFKPDFQKLPFLAPALHADIQGKDGFPILNKWLESSVPNLHFAGALGGFTFGPICRFIAGSVFAARQIAQYTAHQQGARASCAR
jgi:pyruvate/2-oxoglutarate dehydrogenase complex dihydrolipoamide dehydrogenase (E3) component